MAVGLVCLAYITFHAVYSQIWGGKINKLEEWAGFLDKNGMEGTLCLLAL